MASVMATGWEKNRIQIVLVQRGGCFSYAETLSRTCGEIPLRFGTKGHPPLFGVFRHHRSCRAQIGSFIRAPTENESIDERERAVNWFH